MRGKVGSLVVAVPAPPEHLKGNLKPLRYPLSDADGFQGYLQKAWPRSQPEWHVRLPNGSTAATLAAVREAVAGLAKGVPFDMFFLYLTGHGALDGQDAAWFCTEGLAVGERGIDPAELDRLLAEVPARNTLLFIDCCHAARIVQGATFFTTLPADVLARLYICSSQAGQLTWEDDSYGQGLFSAALLEALRTGSPARDRSGLLSTAPDVDIDGELFPYLCREVPLVVDRRKGHVQEPVKGGVARWSVRLPTGDNPGASTGETVLGAVLNRLRRIAVAATLGLIASVLFAEYFLYYLAVDGDGQLAVRRGIRPSGWLVPGRVATRVQTDFSEGDLAPDSDRLGSLRGGSVFGVWHHLDPAGYRLWLDDARPALKAPVCARTIFELTGHLPRSVIADAPGYFQGWRAELAAESLLIDPEGSSARADRLADWVPRLSAVDPGTGIIRGADLDFTVLKLSTDEVLRLQSAMSMWAIADADAVFPAFLDLVRTVCYRAAHNLPEEDALREMQGLRDVLRSVGAARSVRGLPALGEGQLRQLMEEAARLERYGRGRRVWALAPAASLGSLPDQRQFQAELLQVFVTFDPDRQGSLLDLHQVIALEGLGHSAAGRRLDPEVFTKLLELTRRFPEPLLGVPDVERCLLSIAPRQPLPPEIRAVLWRFVRADGEPLDPPRLTALRLLAAGALHLPRDERGMVVAAAAAIGPSTGRMKVAAEIYGWLAAHGLATDEMIKSLDDALMPGKRPAGPTEGEVPALVIAGNSDEPAGIALGQALQKRALPEGTADRLYRWAVSRRSLHDRDDLIAGLTAQRGRENRRPVAAATIRSVISGCSRHSAMRSLEIQIAIHQLVAAPRPNETGSWMTSGAASWSNKR